MNIIQPREISAKIMTLLELSKEKVVLISPYIQFNEWPQMKTSIEKVKKKGIEIEFYTRENEVKSINEIKKIGIEPILIPNLHAKIYMNEKKGIITSQNLYLYSDINSLDIGVEVEGEDYNDLQDYYTNYVLPFKLDSKDSNEMIGKSEMTEFDDNLYQIDNIYDMISIIIEDKYPNWNVRYNKKGYEYKFEIVNRNFELNYEFQNGNTFIIFTSIISSILCDFYIENEAILKKNLGDEFEVVNPGGNSYSYLLYPVCLPERKLAYCTQDQIIETAKQIANVFTYSAEIVLKTNNHELMNCIEYIKNR